jgi:hypothetical protein
VAIAAIRAEIEGADAEERAKMRNGARVAVRLLSEVVVRWRGGSKR